MSRTERVVAAALLALSGLVACASPPAAPTATCQSDEACSATARCIASACVENSPPIARFRVSGELQATSEVTLDASTSTDPDEDDSIVSYAWKIEKTNAACDAPPVSDTTPTIRVRFGCAGS
ncbi:MAG TPA: hypothetical protein VEA99_17345, partial [Gemmatimonadaceae bacterium]|nr:hypothetical protein [Gemmatimonadaceae bacterium]